jgi:nitrite reductase/ring-hydroxylating ferredoxin subunit
MSHAADFKRLVETGKGTPGGELLRRYWQPVALTSDLGKRPLAITVMGEELVLFRDNNGKVGLLSRYCPHRAVDLSYGRIENGGLRCLYHGWLMDHRGHCLDQPAEPVESTYKDEIRHTAYPCREAAGAVFAYLGPGMRRSSRISISSRRRIRTSINASSSTLATTCRRMRAISIRRISPSCTASRSRMRIAAKKHKSCKAC